MPQNRHWRNGVYRKRWTCPDHKGGVRKTIVGKPCPTCGKLGKVAEKLLVKK